MKDNTTTNTPFEDGLDEIMKSLVAYGVLQDVNEFSHKQMAVEFPDEMSFFQAKAALTQLHKAAIVAELEHITAEGDDAAIPLYWYNDDEGHYHEIDIPTRIEQYKKEGKDNG